MQLSHKIHVLDMVAVRILQFLSVVVGTAITTWIAGSQTVELAQIVTEVTVAGDRMYLPDKQTSAYTKRET